jgi:hypothetical protein
MSSNVVKLRPPVKHPRESRPVGDLHETPECATRTLLEFEDIPHRVWECCCGRGAIARVLCAAGHDVLATDLYDHGCEDSESGRDFLAESRMPEGITCIVSNPPYAGDAGSRFVRHALSLKPQLLIMLLPLAFIAAASREDLVRSLSRIHIFAPRLPTMHRDGWTGPRASSSKDHGWFVWHADYLGCHYLNPVNWRQLGGGQ